MPQPRIIETGPSQPSGFEKLATGFFEGLEERRQEHRDQDILNDIFRKNRSQQIDDSQALQEIINTPGISPSKRVANAQVYVDRLKSADAVQKELVKAQVKLQNEQVKEQKKEVKALKVAEILARPENQNATPNEIFKRTYEETKDATLATSVATQLRLQGTADIKSEESIKKEYNGQISTINTLIPKLHGKERKEAEAKRERLQKQRAKDVARFKSGDRNFISSYLEDDLEPELQAEPGQANAQSIQGAPLATPADNAPQPIQAAAPGQLPAEPQQIQQQVIATLTKAFPPASFKGAIKYLPADKSPDGQQHEFKSDGKQWLQVS